MLDGSRNICPMVALSAALTVNSRMSGDFVSLPSIAFSCVSRREPDFGLDEHIAQRRVVVERIAKLHVATRADPVRDRGIGRARPVVDAAEHAVSVQPVGPVVAPARDLAVVNLHGVLGVLAGAQRVLRVLERLEQIDILALEDDLGRELSHRSVRRWPHSPHARPH